MGEITKKILIWIGVLISIAVVILPSRSERPIDSGEVLVYTSDSSVKNYSLPITDGTLETNKSILFGIINLGNTYSSITAEWPNGGHLTTGDSCVLRDNKKTQCNLDGGTVWIEPHNIKAVPDS